MSENEARELVEKEGYTGIKLVERSGEMFVFSCIATDDNEIEVCVIDGVVLPSPV